MSYNLFHTVTVSTVCEFPQIPPSDWIIHFASNGYKRISMDTTFGAYQEVFFVAYDAKGLTTGATLCYTLESYDVLDIDLYIECYDFAEESNEDF